MQDAKRAQITQLLARIAAMKQQLRTKLGSYFLLTALLSSAQPLIRLDAAELPLVRIAHGAFSEKLAIMRSEEHTSELQSPCNLVCRLLLEKKKNHSCHAHARRIAHI